MQKVLWENEAFFVIIIEIMDIKKRSQIRRKKIVAHRAKSFQDAEEWDLSFWQKQRPQDRLSALVAIRKDIAKVNPQRLKE